MNKLLLVFAISITVASGVDMDQIATTVFHALDADKDNTLVQSEFDDYLKKSDPDGDASMSKAQFLQLLTNTSHADAILQFDTYDKNHDKVLDLKDSKLVFKNMDEDGDGHVTLMEFKDKYVDTLVPPKIVPVGK